MLLRIQTEVVRKHVRWMGCRYLTFTSQGVILIRCHFATDPLMGIDSNMHSVVIGSILLNPK